MWENDFSNIFSLLIDCNVKTLEEVVSDSSTTVSKAIPQLLGQPRFNGTFQQRQLWLVEHSDSTAPS